MRILLVGEYSRLHNSLKAGLIALGHEVLLVSDGDGFKQYPSDLSYAASWWSRKPMDYLRQAIYRVSGYDMARTERGRRFKKLLPLLKDFDVVQLINEAPVKTRPSVELKLLQKLISQNRRTFLLCCGVDYMILQYMNSGSAKYTILDEYRANPGLRPYFKYIFEYASAGHKRIHEFLYSTISGVIASDMDYLLPLQGHPKFVGLIPNPVLPPSLPGKAAGSKVVIFLGVNSWTRYQKGIMFFEEALKVIHDKYNERVEIIVAENIPYNDYVKLLQNADIILDQVYAYDQGYNALEAMAMGKVVFTGAEAEFSDYYGLEERVAVNAMPDTSAIVAELSWLIENPAEIAAIGARARDFILKEHNHINIAQRYCDHWAATAYDSK